jgi:hypothetical protein
LPLLAERSDLDTQIGNAVRRDTEKKISEGKVVEVVEVGPPDLVEVDEDTDEEVAQENPGN